MTPRAIIPTAAVLVAVSVFGTWAALDAASREQDQADRIRAAQVITDEDEICAPMCADCRPFCVRVIREAAVPVRLAGGVR